MFPANQFMANPFYNMGAQQPNSLPQTNGQQFQFATPVSNNFTIPFNFLVLHKYCYCKSKPYRKTVSY